MKTILRTYKFLLKPTAEQKEFLEKHLGASRFVYNYFLNQRQKFYSVNGKSINYFDQCYLLTKLKKEPELLWLNEINSQTLTASLKNLDTAFQKFFKKKTGYPKLKTKKSDEGFCVPKGAKIVNHELFIPKLKTGIKCKGSRNYSGLVKSCTIKKDLNGEYYAALLIEESITEFKKTGDKCGIDLGLATLVTLSDGQKFKNYRYYKKYESRLTKVQAGLSSKVQGSNSYENQRRKLVKIHKKIKNSRLDNLHKLSTNLVKKYDVICVESLDILQMTKKSTYAKGIMDAGWGTFIGLLSYKSSWHDRKLIKVDKYFPSSKMCSTCGAINTGLQITDRSWTCSNGHKHDRDVNAAKNILQEGLRL